MSARTVTEGRRGCGYRQPGGLYLVSNPGGIACELLPFALECCRVCGSGMKPARAWTWVVPDDLLAEVFAPHDDLFCPLSAPGMLHPPLVVLPGGEVIDAPSDHRCGLLWVGEAFYSPEEFLRESSRLGVSRRLPAIPRGFRLGETWVLLAHRHAIPATPDEPEPRRGVFAVWKPQRWEYVVKGDESEEELEAWRARDVEPVVIERLDEQEGML